MNVEPGMIVWAEVPDPNGFRKDRPVIVLGIPPDPAQPIICCAVTTLDKDPRPDNYLRLPWDAGGRSLTGLTQPSFAVIGWLVTIVPADVRRSCGRLSPTLFAKLLQRVGELP